MGKGMLEWLKGKKTHLLLGLAGLVWLAKALDLIPEKTADELLTILLGGGGLTLASKVNRLFGAVEETKEKIVEKVEAKVEEVKEGQQAQSPSRERI